MRSSLEIVIESVIIFPLLVSVHTLRRATRRCWNAPCMCQSSCAMAQSISGKSCTPAKAIATDLVSVCTNVIIICTMHTHCLCLPSWSRDLRRRFVQSSPMLATNDSPKVSTRTSRDANLRQGRRELLPPVQRPEGQSSPHSISRVRKCGIVFQRFAPFSCASFL